MAIISFLIVLFLFIIVFIILIFISIAFHLISGINRSKTNLPLLPLKKISEGELPVSRKRKPIPIKDSRVKWARHPVTSHWLQYKYEQTNHWAAHPYITCPVSTSYYANLHWLKVTHVHCPYFQTRSILRTNFQRSQMRWVGVIMRCFQLHGAEDFSDYHKPHKNTHENSNITFTKALSNVRV